jgi:gluconokinase
VPVFDYSWVYRLDRETAIYGAAISNGGLMLDWMLDMLGGNGELRAAVARLQPGAHRLTILPFIAGERSPIWNDQARGVIAGLSAATTRADLFRAAMEAVALRLAVIYDAVAPLAAPSHQVIAGGAALLRSDLLLQTVTDALGRSLIALDPALEASARGAALLAREAATRDGAAAVDPAAGRDPIEPDPSSAGILRAERLRQERLLSLLYPHGSAWDDAIS